MLPAKHITFNSIDGKVNVKDPTVFQSNITLVKIEDFDTDDSNSKSENLQSNYDENEDDCWKTDWNSVYIVTLVSFIGAVHQNCMNVWPYLQLMDNTATEFFYGIMRSASGLGSGSAALIAGYICNVLQDTKGPMVFGKAMAIFSCILYISIETIKSSRKTAFLIFEFFLGISAGSANVFRVYIAHNSTEADRPKAVGICSLAPGFGLLVGTIMQFASTVITYPGVPFVFGTHINLFTAPMLMTIIISIIGLILLLCFFNGKMHIESEVNLIMKSTGCQQPVEIKLKNDQSDNLASVSFSTVVKIAKFDWSAALLCMFTRATISISLIIFMTIGSPYMMIVFQWTSAEAVKYQAFLLGLVGVHIIIWNFAYIFFDFQSKLSERKAIILALIVLFISFFTTYPWPFISKTIPYQVVERIGFSNLTETVGCPIKFKWCGHTPAVNMYVFLLSVVLTMGFAIPLSMINLDILFSKILGCSIKQGTMQGLFVVCGDGLNVMLPLVVSKFYMYYGPIHIWQSTMTVIVICLIGWIILYSRMISNTIRCEKIRKKMNN